MRCVTRRSLSRRAFVRQGAVLGQSPTANRRLKATTGHERIMARQPVALRWWPPQSASLGQMDCQTRTPSGCMKTSRICRCRQHGSRLHGAFAVCHDGTWTKSTPTGSTFASWRSRRRGLEPSCLGSILVPQQQRTSTSPRSTCFENPTVTSGTCPTVLDRIPLRDNERAIEAEVGAVPSVVQRNR